MSIGQLTELTEYDNPWNYYNVANRKENLYKKSMH